MKSTTLFNWDILIWLALPVASRVVAPVQNTLGPGSARGRREPRRRLCLGQGPRHRAVSGAFRRGAAGRAGRSAPVAVSDPDLGGGNDCGPGIHRHCPGHILEVASPARNRRCPSLWRGRGASAPAPGAGSGDLPVPAGHDSLRADPPRSPCLGRRAEARRPGRSRQDLLRLGMNARYEVRRLLVQDPVGGVREGR